MSVEGGMVEGFNKTAGGVWRNRPPVTESPSGDGMTLRVGWGRLVIGDFARIGRVITARTVAIRRVFLPVEGAMVEGFNKTAGGVW